MKEKLSFRAHYFLVLLISALCSENAFAQLQKPDSNLYDYRKIYSYCLDADVKSALLLIEEKDKLVSVDQKFKVSFEQRFKYNDDRSDFLRSKESSINSLLKVFHTYWRRNLLTDIKESDSLFTDELYFFLKNNYSPARDLSWENDSIDVYLKEYVEQFSMHTTGFGKTGRLFDLLVWAKEKDTTYTFNLKGETTSARVVLMDNFITLGWEEYATLGKYYPGGWATKDGLYCVSKAYDLKSEKFLISYLAHESRHFADYKLFPDLKSADLEYRAKLVELSMAHATLYGLIEFFIANGNKDSENGHSAANFRAIESLSKKIFNVPYEKSIAKWKTISVGKINDAAYDVLLGDTKQRM